jgi:pimeloyl-ACP methyl ester carboxylesterase
MRTELVTIETATTPLDGAFYLPDEGKAIGGVLLFHGNTMNFYVGAPRFLPPVLTALGFACLAFNRRGHDILSIRDSFTPEGAAFQLTGDGIADNNIAADWMKARGFPACIVIGHSNGGMLGVRHACDHPETPALVLLSAHRGGTSVIESQHRRGILAGTAADEVMRKAQALVAAGRGHELMSVPGWWYVLSAESYVDRMTQMPDILELAPSVHCPVLFIRGDKEPPSLIVAEEFQACASTDCSVEIIPDCDHFYVGREDAVCGIVSSWLQQKVVHAHLV